MPTFPLTPCHTLKLCATLPQHIVKASTNLALSSTNFVALTPPAPKKRWSGPVAGMHGPCHKQHYLSRRRRHCFCRSCCFNCCYLLLLLLIDFLCCSTLDLCCMFLYVLIIFWIMCKLYKTRESDACVNLTLMPTPKVAST